MRVNNDHQKGNALISYQVLKSLRKCKGISLENLLLILQLERLKVMLHRRICNDDF